MISPPHPLAGGRHIATEESRPALSPHLAASDFHRWYWTKVELIHFARSLALPTSGGKQLLTERIAAALAGTEVAAPVPRPARTQQLSGQLNAETVIPRGQRCSQVVRAWFIEHVGPGFRFDEPMREFLSKTDGTDTLADALAHWHATRHTARKAIGSQFEYNRFTRDWYAKNPGGTRDQLLNAWQAYRARPVDGRAEI